MAPGNKERHPGHTGTIPKTKVRNNCNVPQEAVTPTRRDMATNLVTTSLDWVPVSEYNTRLNCNQARKKTNHTSEQELTDLDNSVAFESGFGRFVPVRPQPRALPLTVQNREVLTADHQDDDEGSSINSHLLHPYAHQMQNGLMPHSNHATAAVMIVNPTTPNSVTGNMSQPFNAQNQNRNNLTRNLNSTRNTFEGNSSNNNNTSPQISNQRSGTKSVNLMNNMYDQSQGPFNNINENNSVHRDSARALGEAIVAACPDAAAVERRLGQIREYIRVTSSLVDTMRSSEDEAFVEHTKEEYDELVGMVMKLKESETKLETMLLNGDCSEITESGLEQGNLPTNSINNQQTVEGSVNDEAIPVHEKACNINNNANISTLKKVTNVENEQLNKTTARSIEDIHAHKEAAKPSNSEEECEGTGVEIREIETIPNQPPTKQDHGLNDTLRKNILSCVEKIAIIEEMKHKDSNNNEEPNSDVVVRPVSVQSNNGSTYSDSDLWQNEIRNKMEMSQIRLTALKQQQKRLLKYQAEAKQQLDEMNKQDQGQDPHHPSTSQDNFPLQNLAPNYHNSNRMYAANQIGVATTLPQNSEVVENQQIPTNNMDEPGRSNHSTMTHEDRFLIRDSNVPSIGDGVGDSEVEDEAVLQERGRALQAKLRDLQLKKQHMENLVTEFQKLQMATRLGSSRNTYSSSGEDSADEEPTTKCNNQGVSNLNNEDPFKLMEIKAIKTALQKTKDLMRSVETFESDHLSTGHEDGFHMSSHSNIHDNKSEGGGSVGGWSNDGSVCRVRNSLPQRHKFTNEQHSQQQQQLQQQHLQQQQLQQLHQRQQQLQQLQQQQQQQMQQHQQLQHQQQSHEENINSLQEMAQELRMETEKIMGERARIKDLISNKEQIRKQKKVNEEARGASSATPTPAERRLLQLRALLAEKQRELDVMLTRQAMNESDDSKSKSDFRAASAVQSYNSEQEEPESRSEHIAMDPDSPRENDNFRTGGDSVLGARSINTVPSHVGSTYGSDSDSASRNKSNQRNRSRRRTLERQTEENNVPLQNNSNPIVRNDPRQETNVNINPPAVPNSHPDHPGHLPFNHIQPPCWNTTKSNQDVRTNQFTQNSHSQTMERLMGPHMFPPTLPYNMMIPYGMMGGCGCGCSAWGAWCWQQLLLQQRDIHQLRDQLTHLEERWRAENASHTLNNQVPPGNRANNYWDNFRSYSRQNLLSTNSKTNADGHFVGPSHNPHPLVERSHNSLHHSASPSPKRNSNTVTSTQPNDNPPRNVGYERSLSFSSAPDVLNVNQNTDADSTTHTRNDEPANSNLNRQETTNAFRNLNYSNPIPEIIQSHSNNLNTPANAKRKSSSKLPSKNSANRGNYTLDFSQTSNINIASTSDAPNPNLASTSRDVQDKASSKIFDLLRENIYSEVTTLIGVNESHPDFLIQLFRELQSVNSEQHRQKVLQSIRGVMSQYHSLVENQVDSIDERRETGEANASSEAAADTSNHDCSEPTACSNAVQYENILRFLLLKSEDIFTHELLESLASLIIDNSTESKQTKKLYDALAQYEGSRICDASSSIIENLPHWLPATIDGDESSQITSEISESSILQDVAGSLNLFSSSEGQLHQMNACPYDMWPGHVHMDGADLNDNSQRSQDGKVDLINCSEMLNGDLAEADQTCRADVADNSTPANEVPNSEALPDVVDTDEVTPTEAEAEWLGLDRVPTRLHMEEASEKQKDKR